MNVTRPNGWRIAELVSAGYYVDCHTGNAPVRLGKGKAVFRSDPAGFVRADDRGHRIYWFETALIQQSVLT